jgi:hypothetical protein
MVYANRRHQPTPVGSLTVKTINGSFTLEM